MKNLYKLIRIVVMIPAIVLFTASCGDLEGGQLTAPNNIKIEIDSVKSPTREIMVITWDEVANASGYEIHSVSVGCGSANRLINTKEGTAFGLTFTGTTEEIAQRNGPFTVGDTSTIWDSTADSNKGANGRVEIIGKNKIEITLMPEWNTPGDNTSGAKNNSIMASQLRVKVKALGGIVDDLEYTDSNYSAEATKDTSAL
ncbi:MAG: hypothetical protein FWB95_01345 [Treponema sp.]|nr:hypothetical protein [Treponema sp.]